MKKEWINPTINMLGASQTKSDDTLFVDDGDEKAVKCIKCGHHHKPTKPCVPGPSLDDPNIDPDFGVEFS